MATTLLSLLQVLHLRSKQKGEREEPASTLVDAKATLEVPGSFLVSPCPELVTLAANEAEKWSSKLDTWLTY